MTFEIAISTMNKDNNEIVSMLREENISCNCLVVNQCNRNSYEIIQIDNQAIRIINTTERGLSRSRNMALNNSNADILAFADDDLFYYKDFDEKIISYYLSHSYADIVLFNMDDWERVYPKKSKKCSFLRLSSFTSMQITLRPKQIKCRFNTLFGSGSGSFNSGEENIFLADCFKHKYKIYYCSEKILKREYCKSSWFKGYNDEKYITDRGAVYYAISNILYIPYIFRFAIKKRKLINPVSIPKAILLMLKGKRQLVRLYNHSRNRKY